MKPDRSTLARRAGWLLATFAWIAFSAASARAANVTWSVAGNVTACPAGDTTSVASHPSRLRITLTYNDGGGSPRNLVPPDSVWADLSTTSGNLVVNDAAAASTGSDQWSVHADDSTRTGAARITVVSFSGCGSLRVTLHVSGVSQGNTTVTVRSTDTNGDGRVTSADASSPCDLNYNGSSDDASIVNAHLDHWHRNALFGTLVQRTNLCETCTVGNTPGNIGSGDLSWSPDGKYVAYSRRDSLGPTTFGTCVVYVVPSNPKDGDTSQKFSFPAAGGHDYDPSWSPLGTEIVWDRQDRHLYRKGVPGLSADTTEHLFFNNTDQGLLYCTETSVSPDGRTVAFVGNDGTHGQRVYTIPITGGTATQISTGNSSDSDSYPKWSPDGLTITFFREGGGVPRAIYTVPADGSASPSVFYAPSGLHAQDGDFSPDGAVILGGVGPTTTSTTPYVFDRNLPGSPPAIPSYPEYFGAGLPTPTFSADGTRIALIARRPGQTSGSPEVWATRLNMNLPPVMDSLAGSTPVAATPYVDRTAPATNLFEFNVHATDPEGDTLTYAAYYLRGDLGMSFNASTRHFTWTAPYGEIGNTYTVKFVATTRSGGTASGLVRITVGIPNDLVISNTTISDTTVYEAVNTITAGPAVTVASGGDATFHVTSSSGSITLADGFSAVSGSVFHAYVADGTFLLASIPEVAVAAPAPVEVEGVSAHDANATVALQFALEPGVPNPFGVETALRFSLPTPQHVRLDIFDPAGRRVRTLVDRDFATGRHVVSWDGRDASGVPVRAGVYLYRVLAGPFQARRKIVRL